MLSATETGNKHRLYGSSRLKKNLLTCYSAVETFFMFWNVFFSYRDAHGMTALMFGVMYDLQRIVRLLLENGADLSISTPDGESVLSMAVGAGKCIFNAPALKIGGHIEGYQPGGASFFFFLLDYRWYLLTCTR